MVTQQLIAEIIVVMLAGYVVHGLKSAATANPLLAPGSIRAVTFTFAVTAAAVVLVAVGQIDVQIRFWPFY